nr:hypothetical protein COLO4_14452 [Ipomoea batatas]
MLVEEQIFRDTESGVGADNSDADHQCGDQNRSDAGEENDDDCGDEQGAEEAENYGNQGKVVDLEVGVVLADAESGIGDGIRLREGGAVHELRPGTAVGEAVAYGIGDVVYEGTESRGGCYDDGVGGGHGGAGGLSIRDGENCRR